MVLILCLLLILINGNELVELWVSVLHWDTWASVRVILLVGLCRGECSPLRCWYGGRSIALKFVGVNSLGNMNQWSRHLGRNLSLLSTCNVWGAESYMHSCFLLFHICKLQTLVWQEFLKDSFIGCSYNEYIMYNCI